jgi:renalase
LDQKESRRMTNSPDRINSVAVIGAGLAGLTVAAQLHAQGVEVVVFDKSKGPGGRCATRRNNAGWFDHGAPSAQVTTAQFKAHLAHLHSVGVVAPIDDGHAWVGQPFMNAWMRHAAQGLTVKTSTQIAAIEQEGHAWRLRALDGTGLNAAPTRLFDVVVVATPAEQATPLLAPSTSLAEAMRTTRSNPCWTAMACWPNPLPITQSTLRNDDPLAALGLAICQDDLPGRATFPDGTNADGTRWVLHAGSEWSTHNLDASADAVTQRLLDALAQTVDVRLARPSWCAAHRWRYAQVAEARSEPFGWDDQIQLATCGDAWHAGEGLQGLERAWLSATALGQHIRSKCPQRS